MGVVSNHLNCKHQRKMKFYNNCCIYLFALTYYSITVSANPVRSKRDIEDFQIYDTNGDKKITREEFEEEWKGRNEIFGHSIPEKLIKELRQQKFSNLDKDKDGKLDLMEWVYGTFEKEVNKMAFKVFDTDHDGKIVVDEVKTEVQKTDIDRDGVVSLKEFTEWRVDE